VDLHHGVPLTKEIMMGETLGQIRHFTDVWILSIRCHSRENGNPEIKNQFPWIPAFAGMTNSKTTHNGFKLDSKGWEK